jgi:hypothetical protein
MNWILARRELLRKLGLGAACLPLLRATRAHALPQPTKKLICVVAIHGYRQSAWKPAVGSLVDQTLPPSVAPLESHKADLLFATGLANRGGSGDAGYGTLFWGLPDVVGTTYVEPNGKTLDQVVADGLPRPLGGRPTLNLAVQTDLPPVATALPGGRCAFWAGPGQPINPLLDPLPVYLELFGGSPSTIDAAQASRLIFQRKSVLDYVGGSLERFAHRVGTDDKMAIQRHIQAIRELETNLSQFSAGACTPSAPPPIKADDPTAYLAVLKAHFDLMVAALSCGVTRVATLQLADAIGRNVNVFGSMGIGPPMAAANYRTWADLAHNPVLDGVDWKQKLDQWWMTRYAELIARMKNTPDANGTTLFDNSVIVWANPVEDSNHDSSKMPWLLAGSCGGAFKTGQSAATAGTNSSGVLAAICTAMGVTGPFGTPTRGLLA